MNSPTLICQFTKDDDRTITYIHDDEDNMYFKISDYHKGDNVITVEGAESMNFMMNLLASNGWESKEVVI